MSATALASSAAVDDWSSAVSFAAELGVKRCLTTQYYELRLARGSEQVDYLAAFYRSGAADLRQALLTRSSEAVAFRTEEWLAIDRLLGDWVSGKSLAARRTPCIWFEQDDYVRRPFGAAPSISVCLTPAYRIDEPHQHGAEADLAHAREALELLGAEPDATLTRAFETLPEGARFIHLSYMLGRERKAVKLYGVLRRDQLLGYLERFGWAGDIGEVELALRRLYPAEILGDELYLDLNLDDASDPSRCTLGLAVAQQHLLRGLDSDPTRARLLKVWEAAGLCDPAKVDAVRAWPGTSRSHPRFFLRDVRFLDIKLVFRAAHGWQAKAYVGRELKPSLF